MMKPTGSTEAVRIEDLDDAGLVEHARQRDPAAFWLIIKRHNQRLHRVARAVLNDDTEAEDVLQETYIHAFTIWRNSARRRGCRPGSPGSR